LRNPQLAAIGFEIEQRTYAATKQPPKQHLAPAEKSPKNIINIQKLLLDCWDILKPKYLDVKGIFELSGKYYGR
jgi:hypothetical protein